MDRETIANLSEDFQRQLRWYTIINNKAASPQNALPLDTTKNTGIPILTGFYIYSSCSQYFQGSLTQYIL